MSDDEKKHTQINIRVGDMDIRRLNALAKLMEMNHSQVVRHLVKSAYAAMKGAK